MPQGTESSITSVQWIHERKVTSSPAQRIGVYVRAWQPEQGGGLSDALSPNEVSAKMKGQPGLSSLPSHGRASFMSALFHLGSLSQWAEVAGLVLPVPGPSQSTVSGCPAWPLSLLNPVQGVCRCFPRLLGDAHTFLTTCSLVLWTLQDQATTLTWLQEESSGASQTLPCNTLWGPPDLLFSSP